MLEDEYSSEKIYPKEEWLLPRRTKASQRVHILRMNAPEEDSRPEDNGPEEDALEEHPRALLRPGRPRRRGPRRPGQRRTDAPKDCEYT